MHFLRHEGTVSKSDVLKRCVWFYRKLMRPLSGSHAKRSPTSEHDDTSPLALSSAPAFRPTPPVLAKSEESPARMTTAGIRLPPVFNTSPSSVQVSPPLHSAPELARFAIPLACLRHSPSCDSCQHCRALPKYNADACCESTKYLITGIC